MGKGIKVLLFVTMFVVIALLASAGVIIYNTSTAEKNIFNGVYVNDISLGGMSKEEARKVLEEKLNKPISSRTISLNAESYKYTLKYDELNAHYDIETAVNKAFEYGKKDNFINKTRNRLLLKKEPVNIELEFKFDTSIVSKVTKDVNGKVYKDPKDAKISFDGKNFKVTTDEAGVKVNEEKLGQLIEEAVKPESTVDNITVPIEKIEAKVKGDMLSKINTKISSFTTAFKPSDVNRTENIKIASMQANGALILPGDVFSMNKALGPRVVAKGYKEAPVIINGTVVPGLAGGICQVTSTIYNAALLSNLEIVERRQHGLAVSYVGVGRDATISGNYIDFKFRNTNKFPIYLYIGIGKSSLTVSLYGANEHPGQLVQITSEVLERIKLDVEYIYDNTLDNGTKITEEKPITGIKSKTYKKVFQDGKLVSSVLLSEDFYKPVKGRIRVGTKPVSGGEVPVSNTEPSDTEGSEEIPEDGIYPPGNG